MLTVDEIVVILLEGLFGPPMLFFALGIISVLVKSDLEVPAAMRTGLAMFLLAAIGLNGGSEAVVALVKYPALLAVIIIAALFSIFCGVFISFSTGNILKKFAGLKTADAWAAAGHYGAVSSATLAVGVSIAAAAQEAVGSGILVFGGWMPALYPFMDSPALISAILIGRIALAKEGIGGGAKVDPKKILHEGVFGMAVWLLVASLVIGMLAQYFSPKEMDRTMLFFGDMFRGVLCLFLLDMGLAAGKQIGALKELGKRIGRAFMVAFILPQLWGVMGILGIYALHLAFPGLLGWGDAFVFATIAGGCSFVSAPAAMRASIPEANPSIYLPMAVALTFPFNIIIGMPLWQIMCRVLWGA